MEELICPKCGPIETEYYTELKSNNLVARCNKCGSFIKNIAQGTEPVLYVGKHKGKAVKDIDDLPYLKWAIVNMTTVKPKIKYAIQKQIDHLEHLAK
jgi:hypothetical protein